MTRCVLLDALGTLVRLEPPWDHLDGEPSEPLERAFRAEMSYYREHSDEGRDPDSLAALRRRCAAILSAELGREVAVEEMMAAIRFRAYPDAAPALAELRALGVQLVCVSNWDYSLPDVLARVGLADELDGVLTSAAVGARKPDPRLFEAALEVAGCAADEALHVGDAPTEDVEGARAAGIRALLIDRDGGGDIESLRAIRHHLDW
ncbi:MAG TPA: HAD family hydrolase [Solirubrobacterales bacterium]|nr:HAD family hydrolase [Solirubrobacterales bacterium]